MENQSGMEYRYLGKSSGLKVSCLSLGNWLNSNKEEDYLTFESILKRGLELGINYLDTAEVYGNGEGERQLGKALKNLKVKRENIVVSTKLFWIDSKIKRINNVGLSRKHIIENLDASLERLQLDYVDIVFCHRFDPDTPLEEICRTFDDLIRRNKTFYWGTSQWNAWEIVDAIGICEKYNLIKPVVEQPHYNMIIRDKFEQELSYVIDRKGLGTTVWSPMAGGFLSGKYSQDNWPEQCRMNKYKQDIESFYLPLFFDEKVKQQRMNQITALKKVIQDFNLECSLAQLSLAWVLINKDVSTAIMGCSSIQQLEHNINAVQLYLKFKDHHQLWQAIENALDNRPTPQTNFRTMQPYPHRR